MIEQLEQVEKQALAELEAITTVESLRTWRSTYLAKVGPIAEISRGMGKLSAEERPRVGQRINAVKQSLQGAYDTLEQKLIAEQRARELEHDRVDVTLPGRPVPAGRLHPTTQTLREIERIFANMGFTVWESPEVETDEYNFGLLNFPPDHPARDMQDTFFVKMPPGSPKVVMRTHTSPGQIHAMRKFAPEPVRVILPGKCYRMEQVTARSEMMFYQVEGLAVGENITMGDLKGTLQEFALQMYGPEATIRFRPSYFPFTEPSVEVDARCFLCSGKGCRMCKYSGWLEILGAGMVHPNVLRNGGYDPERFSGFAFGMGPERIAILKYGIDDIRWFWSGDLRFLEQF
ncbi:MAG TPA: phenylalanine--tRNA ligase subunit alpha [Herpetosiphonaceae bacterium]